MLILVYDTNEEISDALILVYGISVCRMQHEVNKCV